MINGPRPPRDAPPLAEPPNVTRNDIGRGVDFSGCVTGWDVNAADGDLPQERRPQSSSPPFRQGYPPTNTSDSGSNPPGRETAVDAARPAGSAFREQFPPFYDQRAPPQGPQGCPPEALEEPPRTSIVQLLGTPPAMLPTAVPRMYDSDNLGVYDPRGGTPGAAQPHSANQAPLPPSQADGLVFTSALGVLPLSTFDHGYIFPTSTYYDGGMMGYHDFGHPVPFTSTLGLPRLHGVSGRPSVELLSSHAAPYQWDNLPVDGDYRFESERSFSSMQNKNPYGVFLIPHPFEVGPSQPRVTGSSPSIPLLTSPPAELGPRGVKHKLPNASPTSGTTTYNGGRPSGSGLIALGGQHESTKRPRKETRKIFPDKGGGITRVLPRPRRKGILEDPAPAHVRSSTDWLEYQAFNCLQPTPPPATPYRIKIEQSLYVCGNPQRNWVQQNPIEFTVNGLPGIRLTDALDRDFSGPDGRDDQMFQYDAAGSSVSCRLSFPGRLPRSSQITTADHKRAHNPRTRKKLAFEVAKRIKRYVEESKVDVPYEKMVLTKLIHVSKASWQPEIWYDQEPANNS